MKIDYENLIDRILNVYAESLEYKSWKGEEIMTPLDKDVNRARILTIVFDTACGRIYRFRCFHCEHEFAEMENDTKKCPKCKSDTYLFACENCENNQCHDSYHDSTNYEEICEDCTLLSNFQLANWLESFDYKVGENENKESVHQNER